MTIRRLAALTTAASALALVPAGAADARAHLSGFSAFDQRLLHDINTARTDAGLAPLQLNSSLESVAYNWSQHMASVEHASDNPRFRSAMKSACPGWRHVGEEVGVADESTADHLFRVYMRDPAQRSTILSPRFTAVGVATVATDDNGSTFDWNTIELADRCGA